jgi:hypothetical protein
MGPDSLIDRLKAIHESELRVIALIDALAAGDPVSWVQALAHVVRRAHTTDDPDAAAALDAIAHAAGSERLPYTARQRIYETASRLGHPAIARLFLAASPVRATEAQLAKQLAPERPLRPQGRPLTLGERKSLARTTRRDLIVAMCRDPHPDVVAILIDNPHLTEADVVRVAAARPAVPDSLVRVAEHAKWSVRHAVKRALVWNPWTPLDTAIRLATTMRASDLREIAGAESLAATLRVHATELLASAAQPRVEN